MNSPVPPQMQTAALVARTIEQLTQLLKEFQLYGLGHSRTQASYQKFIATFGELQKQFGVRPACVITLHGNRFFLENLPLALRPLEAAPFHAHLSKHRLGGFSLSMTTSPAEWWQLVSALTALFRGKAAQEVGPIKGIEWLGRDEVRKREAGNILVTPRNHLLLEIPEISVGEESYLLAVQALGRVMNEKDEQAPDLFASLDGVSDALVSQFAAAPVKMLPLVTLPYYDNFTFYHSLNVALLTLSAARLVGADEATLKRIGRAALLHDIGKREVPLEILYKVEPLTPGELEILRTHPVAGARILLEQENVDPLQVSAAFGHHIKDNGHGYPRIRPGVRIGSVTRLLQVADIFEALTANRPYKRAHSSHEAFEILYGMPHMRSFRPYIDLLVRAIGFHPVGSRVRTAQGELAIVVGHVDNDPRRPKVRTVQRERDGAVVLSEERVVDISSDSRPLGESGARLLEPEEELDTLLTVGS